MYRTRAHRSIVRALGLGLASGLVISVAGFVTVAGWNGVSDIAQMARSAGHKQLERYWPGYRERILSTAYEAGVRQAKADLEQGVQRILIYGGPPQSYWAAQDEAIASRGYRLESVGTCTVDEERRDFADGYNSVAIARFEREFGVGSYEAVMLEAEASTNDSDI